jgi:acetylornithine deacetylase/succinyl-diaminopimelate desuccinylase-like protein
LTSAPSAPASSGAAQLAADTVEFCSQLIRFDTSNYGGGESRGERAAAEWVAEQLSADGYAPIVLESQPQRASTVVRIAGTEPAAPALLIHGHLDVVPAQASDWSFEPFSGEVRDGAVWGRGALDMKDMDAMMLALARSFAREGYRPPRDIVLAFVADEEDTGEFGAGFLAREHRELFEGVTTAIGESGGHAVHLPDASRLYPIGTGERGSAWMRLSAHGRAGHGSRRNPENAVAILAAAISRIADYRWPVRLTPTVSALLDGLSKHLGITVDPADERSLAQLGEAARLVEATVANSLNPTMLNAGYKLNVIPSEATAGVDGRILPGLQEEFFATVDELLGDKITREFASFSAPVSASPDTTEFAAMAAAITSHDPDALVLPFCMSGGTDAKAFTSLGIACYGFAPGTTPPGFAHWEYVHGVDERVLIDSLEFGVRVLDTYLRTPLAVD